MCNLFFKYNIKRLQLCILSEEITKMYHSIEVSVFVSIAVMLILRSLDINWVRCIDHHRGESEGRTLVKMDRVRES